MGTVDFIRNMKSSIIFSIGILLLAISYSEAACTTDNYAYGGGDILISGYHNIQPTWAACQASCQAITNCKFWTFFKPDYEGSSKNYCELKFEGGGLPLPGCISGPKFC